MNSRRLLLIVMLLAGSPAQAGRPSAGELGIAFAQGVLKVEKDVATIFEGQFSSKEIQVQYDLKTTDTDLPVAKATLSVSGGWEKGWETAIFLFEIHYSSGKWTLAGVTRMTVDDTLQVITT